ncbi:MAG: selenide, water dikinase SelD [Armatimonadota bacterium]
MIDVEKRRRIMQRSVKLGHCICNPRQACPCETFKQKDICPCAGERDEQAIEQVALTTLVEKAGCASKINQNDLKQVLAGLPEVSDPNVLVSSNTCDDAGVYKITEDMALVQTVDVFSPCVDDPYTFGQIAAANSLSDIYAMGGKPLTALSVIGFPIESVSHRVMTQMLRGGMEKMREAGVTVIGGHSINEREPKFGYAVTGLIHPSRIITNDRARPGDVLVLTKPLGVGVISFAGQIGMASSSALAAAADSMTQLNAAAADVMIEMGIETATDVTGFGLLGHLVEMVTQSRVTAEIWFDQVPVFDEVMDLIARGVIPGGIERNIEHSSRFVAADEDLTEEMMAVLYDPQTSGGLLIAVPEEKTGALVSELIKRGVRHTSVIGMVLHESDRRILVRRTATGEPVPTYTRNTEDTRLDEVKSEACCCAGAPAEIDGALPALTSTQAGAEIQKRFGEFMGAVGGDGAIPERTKELIAIALSVLSKCEPCVRIHVEEARRLGVSEEEIAEAIWIAISFGGAPTMMFYRTLCS